VPLVAHLFTGGTPLFTAGALAAMGYRAALWAAARAVHDVLARLRRAGTTDPCRHRLMGAEEYFALVGLPEYEALERRYAEGDAHAS
jgi:2-methylisocitrate lyase-like PEP mutase family enzyme